MFLLYRIIYYVIKWKNYFSISVSCRRRQWHPTLVLLPGKSRGRGSLVGCSPWGRWESDTTEWLHFHFSLSCPGEGSGNPLQCSCLENPRDGGTWWASVYEVTQSQTRLKRLSSSSSSVRCSVLSDFATPWTGSSGQGILQVRILEWVAFLSPEDFSYPGIQLGSPTLQADSLLSQPSVVYLLVNILPIIAVVYLTSKHFAIKLVLPSLIVSQSDAVR